MMRSVLLSDERLSVENPRQFVVVDIVVYHHSDYQMRAITHRSGIPHKDSYSTQWSLPCDVVKVKDKALEVKRLCDSSVDLRLGKYPLYGDDSWDLKMSLLVYMTTKSLTRGKGKSNNCH
eukprot:GHVS01093998.1.p1 GENE.GHVS01093998.1~~GHVS01093998.1.p1  ORF type:complete len:120 (+),score=3.63 GHVS01093998.1:94-453(+)